MINLNLTAVGWAVVDSPVLDEQGKPIPGRILQLQDPQSGIVITVPLAKDIAVQIAQQLRDGPSRIVQAPAGAMPRTPPPGANGR